MKNIWIVLLFLLIKLMLFSIDVSGSQSGEWSSENNPYNIVGNITIPQNDSLIINAGVEIIFSGNFSITAYGYIKAIGSVSDSIFFHSNNQWDEIKLENQSSQNLFYFCKIENATYGIKSINSPLTVRFCKFKNNEVAINLFAAGYQNSAPIIIKNSKITNCQKQGIFIVGGTNTIIDSCDISYCALDNTPHAAIQISNQEQSETTETTISNCNIHHNVWQGISAFDITGNQNIYIQAYTNLIERNLTGIYLLYASGYFSNNTIKDNYVSGNPNSGAGVMVAGSSDNSQVVVPPIFTYNIITGNFTGFYITDEGAVNLGCLENYCDDDDGENQIYANIDESGTTYSVYNASSYGSYAQNNFWDSYDIDEIAQTIIDFNDNPSYGQIIFEPIHPEVNNNNHTFIAQSDIILYPNPVYIDKNHKNLVSFSIKSTLQFDTFKIFNIRGQLIYKEKIGFEKTDFNLNLPNLRDGIYILVLEKNGKKYIKKFTVLTVK